MTNENQLHELAAKCNSSEQCNTFGSVVGMVSTLIKEGRIQELNDFITKEFPEYYLTGKSVQPTI